LITPFIDPNTREKLKFNEDLKQYVPEEQLMQLFGGDCDFEYKHEVFWAAYLKLAAERRERYFAKWKELGGGIGQSEWDMRDDDSPLQTTTSQANGVEGHTGY
jgi:CRAL/TRIO domain